MLKSLLTLVLLSCALLHVVAQSTDNRYFEMRTYHCAENKRPALIERFRQHTIRHFEKHGIENIAYFIPTDTTSNSLTFILAYPDQASRESRWNAFATDPEWQKVMKQSEANGKLLQKIDQTFLTIAHELSPTSQPLSAKKDRIMELRTYYCFPGKLDDIHARFRDHTRKLFEKHGMTNILYWYTVESGNEQAKLVYLLAHDSEASARQSFETFRNDPEWIRVRDASESNGKIVEKVTSLYLKPLEFSPMK